MSIPFVSWWSPSGWTSGMQPAIFDDNDKTLPELGYVPSRFGEEKWDYPIVVWSHREAGLIVEIGEDAARFFVAPEYVAPFYVDKLAQLLDVYSKLHGEYAR